MKGELSTLLTNEVIHVSWKIRIENSTYIVNLSKIVSMINKYLSEREIYKLCDAIKEILNRHGNVRNYVYPIAVGLVSLAHNERGYIE